MSMLETSNILECLWQLSEFCVNYKYSLTMLITMQVKTGEKSILVLFVEVQMLSTIKIVDHFYTELGNTLVFLGVFYYSAIGEQK